MRRVYHVRNCNLLKIKPEPHNPKANAVRTSHDASLIGLNRIAPEVFIDFQGQLSAAWREE